MKKLYHIFIILFAIEACAPKAYDEEGLRTINGTQLYIKAIGQGEPILIVHGGPGLSHRYLRQWLMDLSNDYLLIFYDQRASGESQIDGVPGATITLENFAADIDDIRKSFGVNRMHVLAHSWGGIPAMNYAIRYPENIKSLMLINSVGASAAINSQSNQILAARLTEEDRQARGEIIQTEAFMNREATAIEALMKIGYKHQFYDKEALAALQLQLTHRFGESSSLLQNLASDLNKYDYQRELVNIDIPTLLLYGSYDPLAETAAPQLDSLLQESQLRLIEQSGHFPFVETNEVFLENVLEFLEEL